MSDAGAGSAPEGRLYIHESIMISVEHRKQYLDHFTDVWGPKSRELYGMLCFGVWATSGSTGPWPEAIVMWELEGLHHLTGMMNGEFEFLRKPVEQAEDHFDQFWASAPTGVTPTMGFDRLLVGSPSSRSIQSLVEEGVRGAGYLHQTISVREGTAPDYLTRYESEVVTVVEQHGPRYVGGFRTLLRSDDEVIVIWALPSWSDWEYFGRGVRQEGQLQQFYQDGDMFRERVVAKLLVGSAGSPMEAGRLL